MEPTIATTKESLASRIEPCREFIVEMRSRGATYAEITGELRARCGVRVSIPWLCQFTRRPRGDGAADPVRAAVVRLRGRGRSCAEIVAALRSEHGVEAPRETVLALMRGNPFQSKLEPHRDLVFRRWRQRRTYARIAAELAAEHGVRASLATIHNFIKVRLPRPCSLGPAARAPRKNPFTCRDLRRLDRTPAR